MTENPTRISDGHVNDTTTYASLIERLEKATGPDRQLDVDIEIVVSPKGLQRHAVRGLVTSSICDYPAEHYTRSIDTALTLVPEGWTWMVSNRAPNSLGGRAYLNNRQTHFVGLGAAPNPAFRGVEAIAITPAIALCIAALKATR